MTEIWTTPRNWSSPLFVTDSILNQEIRDRLNNLFIGASGIPGWHQYGRMDSNVTRNNTTTFTDLTNLLFAIEANEVWHFEAFLHGISPTSADFKFGVTAPSGATGRIAAVAQNTTALSSGIPGSAAVGNPIFVSSVGVADEGIQVFGTIVNAGNSGNVQLQFAQWTAVASDSIIYAQSTLLARRIA